MTGISNKHFNAILAKNEIAREIRNYANEPAGNQQDLHISFVVESLKEIEKYLGESNQPSINEIMTSERTDI